jgi:hypothetical protein
MSGAYIRPGEFVVRVNYSGDPTDVRFEKSYSGKNVESALKQLYSNAKASKQIDLPFCTNFSDLIDLDEALQSALERIMAGNIVDPTLPSSVISEAALRNDITFTILKERNGEFIFKITADPRRSFPIRSGAGPSFSKAIKNALLDPFSIPRSKIDALIFLSDEVSLQGYFDGPKTFRLGATIVVQGERSEALREEMTFSGHNFNGTLNSLYNSVQKSRFGEKLSSPIKFHRLLDLDLEVSREFDHIMKDTSRRERFIFTVTKRSGDLVNFRIILDNPEHSVIRTGTGTTLSLAIHAALAAREAIPRSKMDGFVHLNDSFFMHGSYVGQEAFALETETSRGRFVVKGRDFQSALELLFDQVQHTEWGVSVAHQLSFKKILDLSPEAIRNFDSLMRDDLFKEEVSFQATKGADRQVQLQVIIGTAKNSYEPAPIRIALGATLSAAIQDALAARNVIPAGHEYIAMDSLDYQHQLKIHYMTPLERERTLDYATFADSNPESRQFNVEHPGTFVNFSAEQYCRYHRYKSYAGYLNDFSFTNYREDLHRGKVFTIDNNHFQSLKGLKNTVKWDLTRSGFEKVKREFSERFPEDWLKCPHIVFRELYCTH